MVETWMARAKFGDSLFLDTIIALGLLVIRPLTLRS